MKRWICMALLGLLAALAVSAWGESYVNMYTLDDGNNSYFLCEDFVGEAPADSAWMFDELLREGDEVLCGTVFEERYHSDPDQVNRGRALMAVRRAGRILLMGAYGDGKNWNAGIETDGFLPPDAEFSITTTKDGGSFPHLSILCDGVIYEIRTQGNGGAYLYEYSWKEADGSDMRMTCYGSSFWLKKKTEETEKTLCGDVCMPVRLAAWEIGALPKSREEMIAWQQADPFSMEEDEAYITGVNLRERPTGESRSWGRYTAKVRVLGSTPGLQNPWYNVQLGNLTGWVSGTYLHRDLERSNLHIYGAATMVYPVGRADTEITLFSKPDAEAVTTIAEGTLLHVIEENNGWLHVILPRGELTWETDWNGTYGFVKADGVTVGISKTDTMWK